VLESAGIADTDILIALHRQRRGQHRRLPDRPYAVSHAHAQSRVRAAEYTTRAGLFVEGALAVDVWISPEELVTDYITHLLSNPGALQVVDFADGRVQLAGVRARPEGTLVGQPLRILREHLRGATRASPRSTATSG